MKEILALFKLMVVSLALLPFGGLGYFLYAKANAPAYQPTAEEIARAESWATFWQWAGMAFWAAVILAVALAGVGAALLYLLIPALNKIGEFEQAENGLWKPKLRVVSHALDRLNPHRENKHRLYDPNELAMPVLEVHTNGKMDSYGATGGIDYIDQVGIANKVVQAQVMAATARGMNGGSKRGMNQAEARVQSGYHEAQARAQEAKALLAEKRLTDYGNRQNEKTIEAPALSVQPLTLDEAMQRSTPDLFVVGQNETGQLARWSLRTAIHGALIGSTGTGKTSSVGMKIIIDAIQQKHHTLILDGMGGDDLGVFKSHTEWHEMDAETLPDQIAALHRLHELRIGNWSQRIVCVIEEFNDAWESMKNPRLIETYLATLLNKGRHSGIHLLFIAQETRTWPDAVFNGAKARFVFQVGAKEAGRLGEWHAQHLPDQGRFIFRNEEYDPWHVAPRVRTLMNAMPVAQRSRLLPQGTIGNDWERAGNAAENRHSPEVGTLGNGGNEGGVSSPKSPVIPPSLARAFLRSQSWDDFCRGYFEFFPDASQADLRRAMVAIADDGRDTKSFNGEAFRSYHRYSKNGDTEKLDR